MNFESSLIGIVAGGFRCLGLIIALPFGEGALGAVQRLFFALALSAALAPGSTHSVDLLSLGGEFLLGLAIGLPCALLMEMCGSFGELFDTARGQNLGQIVDPLSNQQSAAMGILFRAALLALLCIAGILPVMVSALSESFQVIPPGTVTPHSLVEHGQMMVMLVQRLLHGLFSAFLPLAIFFLLIDLGIGFVGKVKPGFQLSQEGFVAKTLLGIVLLLATLAIAPVASLMHLATPRLDMLLGIP